MNVKYHLRKNIDKLRSRVNTIEREMKCIQKVPEKDLPGGGFEFNNSF